MAVVSWRADKNAYAEAYIPEWVRKGADTASFPILEWADWDADATSDPVHELVDTPIISVPEWVNATGMLMQPLVLFLRMLALLLLLFPCRSARTVTLPSFLSRSAWTSGPVPDWVDAALVQVPQQVVTTSDSVPEEADCLTASSALASRWVLNDFPTFPAPREFANATASVPQ